MAMRQQRGGGNPQSRLRAANRPVYEDFKPISERSQGEEADILLVHLPGFQKEQLKVSMESTKVLRVAGERLIAGNKWSRFQENFEIPNNCNMRGIRAKFENETLTITMPKKIIPQVDSKIASKTSQETPIPTRDAKEKPETSKVQENVPKTDPTADELRQRDGKGGLPARPTKVENEVPKAQEGQDVSNREKAQKGVLEALSPQRSKIEPKSQKGDEDEMPKLKSPEKTLDQNMEKEKRSSEERKESIGKDKNTPESKIPKLDLEKVVEKDKKSSEVIKESIKAENVVGKEHSEIEKAKGRTDLSSGSGGGGGGYRVEGYKKAMKGLAKGLSEERQLMVNMGVAVLVIVALGAYISYSFRSPGKSD